MVERHLDLAQRLAGLVDEAPDLERLADVPLNIVCFRYRPAGCAEEELNALNRRLGEAVLDDGRVFVGTTIYGGTGRLAARDRQLADARERRRPLRGGRPRARRPLLAGTK